MNQIGFLEQQQELRGLSQQIHFLNGKARGAAKRKKCIFNYCGGCVDYALVSMTESEKDAEIVRLRERYVELLRLLGEAMHNGYLDENACSPSWLKEARRVVTSTDVDLGMFRGQ